MLFRSALEAQKKAFLEAEEAYQARAALDEDRLEQGMLNMEGWTRMEVEAATKKNIRAKDEAINSRDQKISKLKEDLAHEKKCREQAQEDIRRIRGERDGQASRIAALVATVDAQKVALAEAEESKKIAGAHRLELEERIRNLEDAVKFRDEAAESMAIVRRDESKKLAESLATVETSKS